MSVMRNRARDQFPMVLVTLLSIVQALALELVWGYIDQHVEPFTFTFESVLNWAQLVATLLGLILIWVVYASVTMRFRWVPSMMDSVYPFIIGLLEFMLVRSLESGNAGRWILLMTAVFALMVRISHLTMRRARSDEANHAFFSRFERATWRDFILHTTILSSLALVGIIVLVTDSRGWTALIGILVCNCLLIWQFSDSWRFWNSSVVEPDEHLKGPESDPD